MVNREIILREWVEDAIETPRIVPVSWSSKDIPLSTGIDKSLTREDGFLLVKDGVLIWIPQSLAMDIKGVKGKLSAQFSGGRLKKGAVKIGEVALKYALSTVTGGIGGAIFTAVKWIAKRSRNNKLVMLPPPIEKLAIYPSSIIGKAEVEIHPGEPDYYLIKIETIFQDETEYGLRIFEDWMYGHLAIHDKNFFVIPDNEYITKFIQILFLQVTNRSVKPDICKITYALGKFGYLSLGPSILFKKTKRHGVIQPAYFVEFGRKTKKGPFDNLDDSLKVLLEIVPIAAKEIEKGINIKEVSQLLEESDKQIRRGKYDTAADMFLNAAKILRTYDCDAFSDYCIELSIEAYKDASVGLLEEQRIEEAGVVFEKIGELYADLEKNILAREYYDNAYDCYLNLARSEENVYKMAIALYKAVFAKINSFHYTNVYKKPFELKLIEETIEQSLFERDDDIKRIKAEPFYNYAETIYQATRFLDINKLNKIDHELLKREGLLHTINRIKEIINATPAMLRKFYLQATHKAATGIKIAEGVIDRAKVKGIVKKAVEKISNTKYMPKEVLEKFLKKCELCETIIPIDATNCPGCGLKI